VKAPANSPQTPDDRAQVQRLEAERGAAWARVTELEAELATMREDYHRACGAIHREQGLVASYREDLHKECAEKRCLREELATTCSQLSLARSQVWGLTHERNHYRERATVAWRRLEWAEAIAHQAMREGLRQTTWLRARLGGLEGQLAKQRARCQTVAATLLFEE
jgi:chromosome segregation ATPase